MGFNSGFKGLIVPKVKLLWPHLLLLIFILLVIVAVVGLDSSVGIATRYGLGGRGSNTSWGEIFRTCSHRPWGPPSLLYNGYRVFPGGKERPGRDADTAPPSSAVGHEIVELYLYSPYGPYGLYRASVPVQGWPLIFLPPPNTSVCHTYIVRNNPRINECFHSMIYFFTVISYPIIL